MILTGDVDLHRPLPAAPDAVARAIADELRRNGCIVRRVAPGVVEFDGPGAVRLSKEDRPAAIVSSGAVWLNPAASDGRMRLALRIGPARLVMAAAWACGVVAMELPVVVRLLLLVVIVAIVWFRFDTARSIFEGWVADGARRA